MSENTYDAIVIGAGITGLAATRQLLGDGLSVANIEASMFGGLVININELDGAIEGSGTDLASNLMIEATELGAVMLTEPVVSMAGSGGSWEVVTEGGKYQARAVVVASGAKLKTLGIPGEAEFEYRGVAQCADCDGPLYRDKDVVVVGGGDSALQEALALANFCRQVHLLNRSEAFHGRASLAEAVAARGNIAVRHRVQARAILGGDGVEKVRVENLADRREEDIPCSGFFGYVGLSPNSGFVPAGAARDEQGFLLTDAGLGTALQGLYAAGAVRAGYGGMLEHAMAEGAAAAKAAAALVKG